MNGDVARRVWEWIAPVFRLVGPILAVAAAALFNYVTSAGSARPRLFGFFGPYFALTTGVVYLAVLLHELGHVLGSRLAGFRVVELAVEPLVVRLDGRGRRLRLVWGVLVGGVRSDPVRPERLRRRHCLVAVCGPAANLVAAVPLLLAAIIDASAHHHRSLTDMVIGLYGVAVDFLARHRADPQAAEQILDIEVRRPFAVFAADAARARAATALAAGRFGQAVDLCERALSKLPSEGSSITVVDQSSCRPSVTRPSGQCAYRPSRIPDLESAAPRGGG